MDHRCIDLCTTWWTISKYGMQWQRIDNLLVHCHYGGKVNKCTITTCITIRTLVFSLSHYTFKLNVSIEAVMLYTRNTRPYSTISKPL